MSDLVHQTTRVRLRRRWPAALLCLTILLAAAVSILGRAEPTDRVERVVDGDTVILEELGRVRLIGVDTPESVHPDYPVEPFGREAAEYTRSRLSGRSLRLEFDEDRLDAHGRTLAYLYLPDGQCFNRELIAAGMAFAYTLYPFRYQMEFLELEDEARRSGVGMWAAVSPEIRHGPLHGNVRSHVYHSANCEYFDCRNCTVRLSSRVEAEKRGFRPHWACVGSRQGTR